MIYALVLRALIPGIAYAELYIYPTERLCVTAQAGLIDNPTLTSHCWPISSEGYECGDKFCWLTEDK